MAELRATYRVQLHAGFTFDDASEILRYLARLGISHLYCSPYLQAAPGSSHGYDVVDPTRVNDELGGRAGLERLSLALEAQGLGQVLDIVPNHMAVHPATNRWWWDVLENGPSSQYASYFDIDWDPPERRLTAQVMVPILGDHYGRVLENGELVVEREGGSFVVRYHEHVLPLSPRTADTIVAAAAHATSSHELEEIAGGLRSLPLAAATDAASVEERHRRKEELRVRLDAVARDAAVASALDDAVAAVNGDVDRLDELLERQNYRLAFWRTARSELGYRRFFDITSLVGLRTEDPRVFADTHKLVLGLVADGVVDGLRVDHVDGLRDPRGYLDRLRVGAGDRAHLVVEKILAPDEQLPPDWPVDGTSGYDFLVDVGALLVDARAEEAMTAIYQRFTGDSRPFEETAYLARIEMLQTSLVTDVERLVEIAVSVVERHRRYRDYTRTDLREAIRELAAAFPVYRSYVRPGSPPSADDVARVEQAAAAVAKGRPDVDPELLQFLVDVALLRRDGPAERELSARFQQLTAPAMAKGVEDTAFYRYNRFVALNEVGGEPSRFGSDVGAFHRRMSQAAHRSSLLATSTHDTKRSEDVRARLAVLAEIPDAWEQAVWAWAHHNERHRRDGWPDRNLEYLLYQSFVGAWPIGTDRAVGYAEKASREAKVHTSWTEPNAAYDGALRAFVEAVLGDAELVSQVEAFLRDHRVVERGWHNSLVQTALKLTCPGVPDLYQGCELWDLSLVDPDNRRPVDFESRAQLLASVEGATRREVAGRWQEGAPKLWLLCRLLRLRAERPELFATAAGYEPVEVRGRCAERIVAFTRAGRLLVVAARFPAAGDDWGDTSIVLPAGAWRAALDGPEPSPSPAATLDGFPVAVFVRDE